ncbi:hypothetical protein GGR42_000408 [Saonia flava]|uniref:Uncharacterized protein n=1 Tax=Saonia flava TaxID=523696 RepID=A0A846QLW3_9FLAO|nr:hypothetical protein [Saonia flava]NJB69946.1 hypothetical protein [Saonia flava]
MLGQETYLFKSPLKLGKYEGLANYTFKIVENDTVLHGTFEIEQSNLNALLNKEDSSFLFRGGFENGQATGPWVFQFGEYQSGSQSNVVDYEYRVLISGVQEEGKGAMENGMPEGPWDYQVSQIKNSEIEKVLFKSSFLFNEGVPQQNFHIENDSYTLVGRFLRDGLAHDEWSAYSTDDINTNESWFFEEGLLRKIISVEDGTPTVIPIFKDKYDETKTIPLNDAYIQVLKATISTEGTLDFKKGIFGLLSQNIDYYQKIDTLLTQLGSSNFEPEFKVKVPYFPLDSEQISVLEKIDSDLKSAKEIRNTHLRNGHLNIVKRTNEDVLFHYNTIQVFSEEFIIPIEKLIALKEAGIIEYINLVHFLDQLWPNGIPNTHIKVPVDGNTRTFELPNATDFDFKGNNLNALYQITNYATLSMKAISEKLSSHLTDHEQLQMLNGVEQGLIEQNESLVAQIDSVSSTFSAPYQHTLLNIKSLADSHLNEYASIENPEEKLTYGNKIQKCLSQYAMLTNTLLSLPDKTEEINTAYQDAVWNPFMANVMEEEVKKRIGAAYSKILIPHFLEEAKTQLTCENVGDLDSAIKFINERMLELREEDTKKLERKLRKEKDPNEIIKLFHQPSVAKEGKNEH